MKRLFRTMAVMNTSTTLANRQALVADASATMRAMALPCLLLATAVAAALICCATTPLLEHAVNPGSVRVLLGLLALPLWLCLLVVFGASLANGAFDWVTPRRPVQAVGVLLVVSVLAYGVGRSAMAQHTTLMVLLPTLALAAAMLLRWWRHA